MTVPTWMYADPMRVMEYKQNGEMMRNSKVRQWAKGLSKIHNRQDRHDYMMHVPEQYRDAVKYLARGKL